MKPICATRAMLAAYENKFKTPVKCRKCGRKIEKGEKLFRTMHTRRYYCQDCGQNVEM